MSVSIGCSCLLFEEIRWLVIFGIIVMFDLVCDRIVVLMCFMLGVIRVISFLIDVLGVLKGMMMVMLVFNICFKGVILMER